MGKSKKLKHLKPIRNAPLDQQIRGENVVKVKDKQKSRSDDNITNEDINQQNVRHF